jgi:putative phosphoesterase
VRLGIVSDIHGNSWALEAALAELKRRSVDAVVNLGDTVWGCLDPSGTADRLMALGGVNIRGNQDRTLFPPQPESADYAFLRQQLRQDQLDWMRTHPPSALVAEAVLACHGTPSSDSTYLLETVGPAGARLGTPAEIAARLGAVDARVVLCGHSHQPGIVQVGSTLVVNPGSTGIPAYDDDTPFPHVMESGSPHARCAVLTQTRDGYQAELLAVPYPFEEAARTAERHGRPDRARWIRTGRA